MRESSPQKIGKQRARRGFLVGFKEYDRRKIAILFEEATFDRLNRMAASREISFSALVRELVQRGLDQQ